MAEHPQDGTETIPILEERLAVEKRVVARTRVRISTVVDEHQAWVREDLAHEEVSVEHVPVDREIAEVPAVRTEGDVTIIPVVEEVIVLERRLVLKEELHVRKTRRTERVEQPVTLRAQRAVVERERLDDSSEPQT